MLFTLKLCNHCNPQVYPDCSQWPVIIVTIVTKVYLEQILYCSQWHVTILTPKYTTSKAFYSQWPVTCHCNQCSKVCHESWSKVPIANQLIPQWVHGVPGDLPTSRAYPYLLYYMTDCKLKVNGCGSCYQFPVVTSYTYLHPMEIAQPYSLSNYQHQLVE